MSWSLDQGQVDSLLALTANTIYSSLSSSILIHQSTIAHVYLHVFPIPLSSTCRALFSTREVLQKRRRRGREAATFRNVDQPCTIPLITLATRSAVSFAINIRHSNYVLGACLNRVPGESRGQFSKIIDPRCERACGRGGRHFSLGKCRGGGT